MKKKLYFLGVGPGERDLITVKAAEILRKSKVVFAPQVKGRSLSLNTVKHLINCKVKFLDFPMTENREVIQEAIRRNLNELIYALDEYGEATFITLGDPMIYSTAAHLLSLLRDDEPVVSGFQVEIVPGVSSITYVASKLRTPLAVMDQVISILPATIKDEVKIKKVLENSNTIVVTKLSPRNRNRILRLVKEMNLTIETFGENYFTTGIIRRR